MSTRVINFVGGPSAGKSTIAPGVFSHMKHLRMNVEFVPEFPKELAWQGNAKEAMDDQLWILGEQNNRQYRLLDKVDWIVTDTSIFLGIIYCQRSNIKYLDPMWTKELEAMTWRTFCQYDNEMFFVNRGDRKFINDGRVHDETESRNIDQVIKLTMEKYGVPYTEVSTIEEVIQKLGLPNR